VAILLAIVSAVGFGSSAIFARLGLQHIRPNLATLVSLAASAVFTMAIALAFNLGDVLLISGFVLLWSAFLGFINYALGRVFNFTALRLVGAARTATVVSVAPLFAIFFAVLFAGEALTLTILFGTLAIVSGLMLIISEGERDDIKAEDK
jgi:transporter family protein